MGYPEAAQRFLDSLDAGRRDQATAAFDDDALRRDWHYVPRARPGLCLADMSAVQQKAAIDLLATGMSEAAFATACVVMALEDVLDAKERGRGPRRGAHREWGRHRAEYHVIVFGTPGDAVWGWRFEGHHVSATMTFARDGVRATPQFLGANPMAVAGSYELFADERRLMDVLLGRMDAAERDAAVVADLAPDDILTTNAARVADVLPPDAGVLVGDLGQDPRNTARELVALYANRLPRGHSLGDADRMRFAFAGLRGAGEPQYYRLQGAAALVEYDCTQDDANHVHTVVRDVDGDFGDDLLRRHRASAH